LKLSIIIPCLNEASYLERLLPWLSDYRNDNLDIIVADAKSSDDNTEDICREYNITYVRCKADQRAAQINQGAHVSTGETLLVLHADVFPSDDFIERIEEVISGGYDFGLFSYKFDKKNLLLTINSLVTNYKGWFCGGGDQCHFISKSLFEKLGGYDEDYDILEDFEFYDRLKKETTITLVKSKATVSSRKYENNNYLKVNLANLIAFCLYKLKYKPRRIKKIYESYLS